MMNNTPHHIIYILLLLLGAATPAIAQTINGNVYGGGNLAQVVGSTTVNIIKGTVSDQNVDDGNIYGGGYGASAVLTGNTTINVTGGTVTKDVYGGGALANVTGSTTVNVSGGTITQDVYGGGALANVSANTSVNLTGGTLHDAYGGGLGSAGVAAYVNGNATTTLNGSKVTGSIFGANNVNGTPQGHVKVHVLSTASRDQANRNTTGTEESFDVMAVYGGGNKAAYIPTANNEKAEVLIENCDNSIAYVYGGGNAAPVPATDVKIYGANAIDNAFAGGNGAGAGNPGADIGYSDYTRDEGHKYGAGTASITVYGGTVHNVFGGSNTLGYIADDAQVNIETQPNDYEGATCDLAITNLFGGGNKANGKAATIAIACTGNGKIENVFGGANQADVEGDISLNITGGNIGNIFGGNNQSGVINGAIAVNINWGSEDCGIKHIDNVYGGGNLAPYTTPGGKAHPTITLTNGTVSNNVYGGGLGEAAVVTGNPIVNLIGGAVTNNIFGGGDAAPVTGNPQVNANYGSVKDIFAGGRGSTAVVTGNPKAYINYIAEDPETHEALTLTINDVYGGGDAANVVGTGKVQLDKGTVANIYGGGNAADITNTDVVINGGEATMAFAGGHGDKTAEPQKEANVTGDAHLTIHGGTVAKAFAGSNSKGTITGSQLVTIVKDANALAELHVTEVYGGGNQADGKAGTFDIGCTGSNTEGIGDLFGGAREANITGNIAFIIEGGKIDRIFGGNNISGNVAGSITVNIAENTTKYDCGLHAGYVYGGGQDAAYTPTTPGAYPAVNIQKGSVEHDVFGGGLGATAVVTSNPTVTISGGSVGNNVFGGGSLAETDGNPTVNVSGGTVTQDVYGGGALANITGNSVVNLLGGSLTNAYGGGLGSNEVAALVGGNATVNLGAMIDDGEGNLSPSGTATADNIFGCNNINGAPQGTVTVTTTSGTVNHNVYGGGNQAAASVSPIVNINGGTITENVYGGGYGATAVITGNPVVTVTGGTISQDVYGGGALANVTGSTEVNIQGGSITQDVYGGGALANVSANTSVNLTGGTIRNSYGGGLGSNEVSALVGGDATTTLNGSKVTGSIFGANNVNGTPQGHVKVHVLATTDREGQTDGQYDVAAVYGGGNKAAYIPSEATFTANKGYAEVLIENCDNSIAYVYGGGNAAPVPATDVKIYGANAIDNAFAGGNGAGAGNPGADIGYSDYTRNEEHKYGAGTASITVYGGTVHNVFGGSNTLGYIRTHAYVDVPSYPDDYEGSQCNLVLGNVHAGGNQAEMYCGGSVTLSCSDGADVVYAGANAADIHGDITLTIASGTYGKVFGGNNQSGNVYGSISVNIDETGCYPIMIGELYGCGNEAAYSVYGYNDDKSCKTSGEKLYDDPVINIYSCTGIGRIFGGGKGSGATVYGNPTVNINTIKGSFAGQDVTPLYILDANCERIENNNALTRIEDNVGKIGTVYGGGNQAAVYGNTTVNIGTLATNKHLNAAPEAPKETVSVRITDNVFGGGKTAEVTGKATVTIGKDQQ